ncbi:TnpX site-specific recombinase [human gut metagenome]|uniref:TnpX site-specific recombinase n=1 Tax=human gut metagenome TaxID=408170 RepID=K1S1Y3_9ZZZZ
MKLFNAGVYLRLSKEEYNNEKESNSITNQRQIIDNYVKEHKEYKLVDYYVDDGYSGTNFDRPEFQRMLEDIKNKKIDVIIIKDLSRLGRNYIETGNFVEVVFPAMGVSVISVDENYEMDSLDYYGSDYVPLKNLFNDMYAKDISKKVRSSLIVKKYNGEFTGKLAPYGYIKDPKDKHKFLIDKNVSHIIKKIFDMILDGKSRRQVADFLNDNDILTPSEYLNINTNEGISMVKKWNPEMVNTILKNENYTGTLFQGKRRKLNYRVNKQIRLDKENWIITPNHHEAIISKEKFDKVQDILNNYVTRTNRKGNLDTLSGFLKCGDCKGQMHLKKGKNKSYYYCTNYFNKKCTSHSIEKTKLEEMILEKLKLNKITRSYLYESVKTIYINDDKTISIDYK